jgi:hypothetical protein
VNFFPNQSVVRKLSLERTRQLKGNWRSSNRTPLLAR